MVGSGIEVVVVFLDVLTVVAFAIGETEKPLFQDRVFFVPQGEGEAQPLLLVADSGQAIFAPAIRAAASVVMGKVVPCIASRGIVFTYRSPLAFTEVRSPEGIVWAGRGFFSG